MREGKGGRRRYPRLLRGPAITPCVIQNADADPPRGTYLAFLAKRDPVSRFTSLVILSAGAIALAACHDSPTPVTAPAGPAPTLDAAPESNEGRPPIRHLMLPKAQAAAAHASKQSTGIFYHGGPVMTGGTKVAAVYWASGPIYANGPTPGTSGATCADGSLIGS